MTLSKWTNDKVATCMVAGNNDRGSSERKMTTMGCGPSFGYGQNLGASHRRTRGHRRRIPKSKLSSNHHARYQLASAHHSKPANVNADATHHSQTVDDNTGEQFINEALQYHNFYRALHGVPPLRHSGTLTAQARTWVSEIAKKDELMNSRCALSNGTIIGENIYMCWSSDGGLDTSVKDAVSSWYEEIHQYSFNKSAFSTETCHFTQVVWKATTAMGIAMARSREGSVYVVANYRPAGNIMGNFKQNVKPLIHTQNDDNNNDAKSNISDW